MNERSRNRREDSMERRIIRQEIFSGERALFHGEDLEISDCLFQDGESPLKESSRIGLSHCLFKWKYPVWYSRDVAIRSSTWYETARAGVWYTRNVSVQDCLIEAPKNFRRCEDVFLKNTAFTNAAETLWNCKNIHLQDVSAKGDYFAMNSENLTVDGLKLTGGYAFDGVKNGEFRNLHLMTKDAFWNSENVTVMDSFISSEYLGWNSKNLTLINCTIESLQGMCYIENLVMKDCILINTELAFEYSTVQGEIKSTIGSIKNPRGGVIRAESIGEIILEENRVDPSGTIIECRRRAEKADAPPVS